MKYAWILTHLCLSQGVSFMQMFQHTKAPVQCQKHSSNWHLSLLPLQIACCDHCVDKYVKMTQRLSLRLQEHYQLQNQVDPSQQQPLSR